MEEVLQSRASAATVPDLLCQFCRRRPSHRDVGFYGVGILFGGAADKRNLVCAWIGAQGGDRLGLVMKQGAGWWRSNGCRALTAFALPRLRQQAFWGDGDGPPPFAGVTR